MKFEYGNKQDDRECVAFIDGDGDLCIKASGPDDVIWMTSFGCNYSEKPCNKFSDQAEVAFKRFYPGDTITITF